jgi:hypothetical protein
MMDKFQKPNSPEPRSLILEENRIKGIKEIKTERVRTFG